MERSRTSPPPSGPRSEAPSGPGTQVGDAGNEPVSELHHDHWIGDRAVPVALAVVTGAVQLRRALARVNPTSRNTVDLVHRVSTGRP
jgi:hypothetical protein